MMINGGLLFVRVNYNDVVHALLIVGVFLIFVHEHTVNIVFAQ